VAFILASRLGKVGKYVAIGLTVLIFVLIVLGISSVLINQNAEKDFNTLYAKANDCFNQHDFNQAVVLYKSALSKLNGAHDKPNLRALALIDLAKAHLELGQTEEAARACSEGLLIMRRNYKPDGADFEKRDGLAVAKASLLLGRIYRKQEKSQDAEEAFRYALQLEEDCLGPLYLKDDIIQNYAELLKHVHRDSEAARLTRTDNESYFSVYEQVKIAHHLISIGRVKEAASMMTETSQFAVDNNLINRDAITCMCDLAQASINQKEYDGAAKAVEQLLAMLDKSGANFPSAYLTAYSVGGHAALARNQVDKANDYLVKALDLINTAPELQVPTIYERKAIVLRLLGQAKFRLHDPKAGSACFNQALKLYAQNHAPASMISGTRQELQAFKSER
jgi:tetratricopeptide (TPR) repeat protein